MGLISEAVKLEQIGDVIGNVLTFQRFGLLMSITVLPFALMFISYTLYKKHYNLDEDYYNEICVKLSVAEETGE